MKFYMQIFGCLIVLLFNCTSHNNDNLTPYNIERFDIEFKQSYYTRDTCRKNVFKKKYGNFIDIYCNGVLRMDIFPDSVFSSHKTALFFNDTLISKIYADVAKKFQNMDDIAIEISKTQKKYKKEFPNHDFPDIYTHISAFNQSYIVGDNLISIALDNFLDNDYPEYSNFFEPYEIKNKNRVYIVPGLIQVLLYTEFPQTVDNKTTLLDRIIYEGKILYATQKLLPDTPSSIITGYDEEQTKWLENNESHMWKTILSKQHLFSTDQLLQHKYIDPAPFTATFTPQSPGRAGRWIGLQIVTRFMNKNKNISLEELLSDTHTSNEILKKSGYKG